MFAPMHKELMGYATALVCMQRLESRHAIAKRVLAFKHRQRPSTLSASLRRKQNSDLEEPEFQERLPEFLASISELHAGAWDSKTDLLNKVGQEASRAEHAALLGLRKEKEVFAEALCAEK